jgi:hypothetical protein
VIRTAKVIFCDNEHGTGDVTFPETLEPQGFIDGPMNTTALRIKAMEVGWGRVNGGDYCPSCMEGM